MISGEVRPGFEEVRVEFIQNFKARGEIGAACAVYHQGEKVVDLWGGHRDAERRLPWQEDTMVLVFSTTKGMAAMALAVAHSRGLFDYDAPVCNYWPAFAQAGKERVTVRQLLSHQAGLAVLDEKITLEALRNPDQLAALLARQRPAWEPGKKHGYHMISLGWYEGALLRCVDPQHRTLGQYFQDEVARPLGLEFYIGLPASIPEERLATIVDYHMVKTLLNINKMPWPFVKALLNPRSQTARSLFLIPGFSRAGDMGKPDLRAVEIPAANGIGLVRSIAKAYGSFACGGRELSLKQETLEALMTPAIAPTDGTFDEILQMETSFSLGYLKPFPGNRFGSSNRAFGTPGAGGSFGFADPDTGMGFAYAPNRSGFYVLDDPRERALRDAAYRCLARLRHLPG